MTHFIFKIAATAAILSTSACISLPQDDAAQFSRGNAAASLDIETGEVSLNNRIVSRDNDPSIRANGQARVTRNAGTAAMTARASDGDTYAIATATQAGTSLIGAVYGRTGGFDRPAGRASYSGDYVGILTGNTGVSGQAVSRIVEGDIGILADFDTDRIGGSILNRRIYGSNGSAQTYLTSDNVRFTPGNISDNGTFSLAATGGNINSQFRRGTVANGSVVGVIGGDTANSIAGHMQMDHKPFGLTTTYQENGAFVGN